MTGGTRLLVQAAPTLHASAPEACISEGEGAARRRAGVRTWRTLSYTRRATPQVASERCGTSLPRRHTPSESGWAGGKGGGAGRHHT